MPLPKLSLILFDWDGFTMITETTRFPAAQRKELNKSSRSTLSYDGQLYNVEILEMSDSRDILEDLDTEWSSTHRADAISAEREKRESAKGRTKRGGFLDVWHDPDMETQAESRDVDVPDQALGTSKTTKEGSNGRRITVLYEGSADTTEDVAPPLRQPFNMDGLGQVERDVIQMQLQFHQDNRVCNGTMTEKVIIIENESELEQLMGQSNTKVTCSSTTQTSPDSQKRASCNKETQTNEFSDQGRLEAKIDEVLSILKNTSRPLNISDIVNWVTSNTPAPSQANPSVTVCLPEVSTDLPTLVLPSRRSEENSLPTLESMEPCQRDLSDASPERVSPLPPLDPPSTTLTAKRPLFSTPAEPGNRLPLADITPVAVNIPVTQVPPVQPVQVQPNRK